MKNLDEKTAQQVNAQSDINRQLGSLLERWYTRDTPGCAFCNVPDPAFTHEDTGAREFCDDECRQDFERIVNARLAVGKRDMAQRGYD